MYYLLSETERKLLTWRASRAVHPMCVPHNRQMVARQSAEDKNELQKTRLKMEENSRPQGTDGTTFLCSIVNSFAFGRGFFPARQGTHLSPIVVQIFRIRLRSHASTYVSMLIRKKTSREDCLKWYNTKTNWTLLSIYKYCVLESNCCEKGFLGDWMQCYGVKE